MGTIDPDLRLRAMTDEERRGFDHACDCLTTWAGQMESVLRTAPRSGVTLPLEALQAEAAKIAGTFARALKQGTGPKH